MINYIRKRNAIKSYVDVLPLLLRKKHGKRKHYSKENVQKEILSAKLNQRFIGYAYAIFLSKHEFDSLKIENISIGDYSSLRSYISKRYFKGNDKFSIHDIFKRIPNRMKYKGTIFNGNVSGELADPDLNGEI